MNQINITDLFVVCHYIYKVPYRRDKAPVSKERQSCVSAGGAGVWKCSLSTKIGYCRSACLGFKGHAKLKSAKSRRYSTHYDQHELLSAIMKRMIIK